MSAVDRRKSILDCLADGEWKSMSMMRTEGLHMWNQPMAYTLVQLLGRGRVRVKRSGGHLIWKRIW